MSPISIIITCFNGGATIARALQSCLAQTTDAEIAQIIVVDDGSTDASASIVRTQSLHDKRIRLLQTGSHGGAARARNWAALHVSTPLIAFLDAHDEYLPGALAAALAHMAERPQDAAVRLDVEFAGFPARLTEHADFERNSAILSNTVPCSLLIRRGVFLALGGFPMDEVFRRHGGEDGALSWVLSEVFAQSRLADAKRVRMHYRDGVYAERFMNIQMGFTPSDPVAAAQVMQVSRAFMDTARANLHQLRSAEVTG
jgi:glycosyltransferase involved in cell wall biosynthesis